MKTRFVHLTYVVFLFACFACSTTNDLSFNSFDQNNDGSVSFNEFEKKYFASLASGWSFDETSTLDDENFYRISFLALDQDNNKKLDPFEWQFVQDVYYDSQLREEAPLADNDNNEIITYSEYYRLTYNAKLFEKIDANQDNYISKNELIQSVFNNWDLNKDGIIEESEYRLLDSRYTEK